MSGLLLSQLFYSETLRAARGGGAGPLLAAGHRGRDARADGSAEGETGQT
jgi:hypothetical protein